MLDDIGKYKKLCDTYSLKINKSRGDELNDINGKIDQLSKKIENNGLSSSINELNSKIDQLSKENRENKEKLEIINRLSQQVNVLIDQNRDTDGYKKITNERIEKLVKLFLIVNNK